MDARAKSYISRHRGCNMWNKEEHLELAFEGNGERGGLRNGSFQQKHLGATTRTWTHHCWLTSSIMVSIASEISLLVASLSTMFLSIRQYSLSWEEGGERKSVTAAQLCDFAHMSCGRSTETHFVIKDVVHPAWGLWAMGLWKALLWYDPVLF